MAVLTVNVIDYNTNRPVPGALVTINGTAVVTNNRGQASFDATPSTYNLSVSCANYTPTAQLLTLTNNQTITIRIVPRLGWL